MKDFPVILIYILASSIISCNHRTPDTKPTYSNKSNPTKSNPSLVKKLYIQPLGPISILKIRNIKRSLEDYYRGQIVINRTIPVPSNAVSSDKKKYNAHKLLQFLSTKSTANSVILGVTDFDICMNKNGNPNFGIFGLGQRPGISCVISTFRLSGSKSTIKIIKVALHEIGHTQGLKHCSLARCLMSDLKGRDRFYEMTHFCQKCKSVFQRKGWSF